MITAGVITTVFVFGGNDQWIESTSDQCPVPYCTTGDRCGTHEECDAAALSETTDAHKTNVPFLVSILALMVLGYLIIWYCDDPDDMKEKFFSIETDVSVLGRVQRGWSTESPLYKEKKKVNQGLIGNASL